MWQIAASGRNLYATVDSTVAKDLEAHAGELGAIAQRWFEVMGDCGDDVRELLNDGPSDRMCRERGIRLRQRLHSSR